MPDSTPIYGIVYPCSGETIDPAVLAEFAETMDAALTQGAAELEQATSRPNAQASALTTQTVAVGVGADLSYETEVYDNDEMFNLALSTSVMDIKTSGAYLIWGAFRLLDGYTTLTSVNLIITVNAIERARYITTTDDIEYEVTVPLDLVVGDSVRMQALWTGTGGPANVTNRALTASFIAAP